MNDSTRRPTPGRPAALRRFSILVLVMLVAACGSDTGTTAAPTTEAVASGTPEAALEAFLAALGAADYPATAEYVDEEQLGLFASIESGDPDALTLMTQGGVPDNVRANFWASFVEAIPSLADPGPGQVRLEEVERFSIEQTQFALIGADFSEDAASGDWILREREPGDWVVDIIATFGVAFVAPLNGWLRTMTPDQRSGVAPLVEAHRPSWDALEDRQGDDEAGVFVRGALQELRALTAATP